MIRCRTAVLSLALAGLMLAAAKADDKKWVTVRGQVKWPEKVAIPAPVKIDVKGEKKCLVKGDIFDDTHIINPKNKGLKNVFVYLRPNNEDRESKLAPADIHPTLLKPKPVVHETDQPCCLFTPKNIGIRTGDFIKFKNSSDIAHNVKLDSDAPGPTFNKTIAPNGFYQDPNAFLAQVTQIEYSCSIHPWMKGKIMVFDHPYFAVTDDDGKFEIKNAPEGKYRIVYHGDRYHKGKAGRFGWEITIKDNGKGTMELEPLEFEIPAQ